MKRLLSIAFLCFTLLPVSAQKRLQLKEEDIVDVVVQIDGMAESLCEYIMIVGSSRSSVSDETKDDIIYNKVPTLFWNYWDDPRMMRTTGGTDGSIVYEKPMYDYFRNLKRQARQSVNHEIKYELTYDRLYASANLYDMRKWERMPNLHDDCEIWRNSIKIKQSYFIIDYAFNDSEKPYAGRITKAEKDEKYLYVYFIRDPKGKARARIGDVYMAIRTDSFEASTN